MAQDSSTATTAPAGSVLSVRVSAEERALLESAAQVAHTSLSEFVRRKAVEAAELELIERRIITIPADKWDEFETWLQKPAEDVPGLRRLAQMKPTWEE